ncbi:MAG: sulfate adenylyltransferase [bacterium]
MRDLIEPHGGRLVDRVVPPDQRTELRETARELPQVALDAVAESDLALLASGACSPLTGFLGRADFAAVQVDLRLASGLPWPLPIVLGCTPSEAEALGGAERVALRRANGSLAGVLELEELYPHDAEAHARAVYGTADPHHPGVAWVQRLGDRLLAGPVSYLPPDSPPPFAENHYPPRELRAELTRRGWQQVVAFQTRNPIHRAHEYLMKCAAESVDGLLLHPLVGPTRSEDLSAEVRMRSYEVLLANYFNPERSLLAVFPAAMRYAGPREALFHALVRQNYGCTHFIVGRDHAGASDAEGRPYYEPLAAQEIFARFAPGEIRIQPLPYEHAFFCRRCDAVVTGKTAPANPETRYHLSGTKVRELLRAGLRPPPEIMRPEVADVLMASLRDAELEREASLGRGL